MIGIIFLSTKARTISSFQIPHTVFTQSRSPLTHVSLLSLSSLSFLQHLHFLSACQHEKLLGSDALKVSLVPSQRLMRLLCVALHLMVSLILSLQLVACPGFTSIPAHGPCPPKLLPPLEPQVLPFSVGPFFLLPPRHAFL